MVSTASYEARPFGVHSAMPMAQARRRCPHLVVVPCHFDRYKAVSRQIHAVFHEYTDLVEPISLDEAFLDVTENKKGMELAVDIAREIKQKILDRTSLTASNFLLPRGFQHSRTLVRSYQSGTAVPFQSSGA